jgi:hypothetical protein
LKKQVLLHHKKIYIIFLIIYILKYFGHTTPVGEFALFLESAEWFGSVVGVVEVGENTEQIMKQSNHFTHGSLS